MKIDIFIFVMLLTTIFASAEMMDCRCDCGSSITKQEQVPLKDGLKVALVVLIVLLVIFGLVLGFSRLKKDKDDEDEGENYY